MQDQQHVSRRSFLQRISLLGAVVGTGAVLGGCGEGEANESCDDLSGLTPEEIQAREEVFQYVDQTPNPEQRCNNCQFWQPDEAGGFCGGCQILAGPVHPEGYCISWAPVPEAVS